MFWLRKVIGDFELLFSGNPFLLDSVFVGIRLDLQSVKPT